MRKTFKLSKEEFDGIIAINKEGGDPVMFLSGGIPMGRSLGEKINDYWMEMGEKHGFDWKTIEPGNPTSDGELTFTAIPK